MLTFEQIKELIELVWKKGLQGVEIERAGFRVKIDGRVMPDRPEAVTESTAKSESPTSAAVTLLESADRFAGPGGETEEVAEEDRAALDGLHLLRSPIVGTFYTSPSPEADPYVVVGARVRRGQVLCIVEAMKLMNEIESDEDGVIEQVFPKNAQPVEYGEPLFAIRPD